MNNIFPYLLDVCVVVYLDDILIYSKDMSQHQEHVKEVLQRLSAHGLYAGAQKCEFHKDTMEYLGFILSSDSLHMAQDKVQCIVDWPEPHKVKDVQSFLSFCNFYHHFIHRYSEIAIPLTWPTCKKVPWNFSEVCRTAFNRLKEEFTQIGRAHV